MRGYLHANRQDTAISTHQATADQSPTSTDTSLPNRSADNLNHYHADVSPAPGCQTQNPPSSPVSQARAQRHSLEELMNDSREERVCPVQKELFHNQMNPGRTAEGSDFDTDECSSPTAEPQPVTPPESRLSLFAGMELVTRGRPLITRRQRETDTTGDSVTANPDPNSPNTLNSVASESSQPVSAFSFLNF